MVINFANCSFLLEQKKTINAEIIGNKSKELNISAIPEKIIISKLKEK